MYPLDSSHVWHVAKSGNNGNSGHAGQYPVNLANDAKLTISAAVSAASAGDTIIIWPGTYVETVNLDTADKGLVLIGTHRDLCIIAPAADHGIILESNSQVHNLSIIANATNKQGIKGSSKSNIIINNCYTFGNYDGIFIEGTSSNIRITNTYSKSNYDGANLNASTGIFIDNCIFETDGGVTTSAVSALVFTSPAYDNLGVIIRNTIMCAARTAASTNACYAFKSSKGYFVMENCNLIAVTKTSATGDAVASLAGSAINNSYYTFKNCSFYSSSNGGTASDIKTFKDSIVVLSNCMYDRTKVLLSGSAKAIDISDANGRVDVAKIEGTDATNAIIAEVDKTKAAKVLLNKAVQDKLTGVIDYYDDDGQTVILTHTPVDGESEIERTPS